MPIDRQLVCLALMKGGLSWDICVFARNKISSALEIQNKRTSELAPANNEAYTASNAAATLRMHSFKQVLPPSEVPKQLPSDHHRVSWLYLLKGVDDDGTLMEPTVLCCGKIWLEGRVGFERREIGRTGDMQICASQNHTVRVILASSSASPPVLVI